MMGRFLGLLLSLLVALPAAAETARPLPEGEALKALILGRWGVSDDGGKTFWGQDTLHADGAIEADGVVGGERFRSTGRFTVTGRIICIEVTATSDPRRLAVGEVFCNEILHVDSRTYTFRRATGAPPVTMYRMPALML